MNARTAKRENGTTFKVIRGRRPAALPLLRNLLRDTSPPILAYLAERYGLRRIPGLPKPALIDRILQQLPPPALRRLQDDLIAARYGNLSIDELLAVALQTDARRHQQAAQPRLEDISPDNAVLSESGPRRWLFTMHGYDVVIDLDARYLACGCTFFQFAARRQALCKHLVCALRLIPEVYARKALIDLLLTREYGGPDTPPWRFDSLREAA